MRKCRVPGPPKPLEESLTRSQRQRIQADGALPGGAAFLLDRDLVPREMEKRTWLLHFIDFEMAMRTLPFHKARRPYGLAPPITHHVLEANGSLPHAGVALPAKSGVDPNIEFLRQLRISLGEMGTVFMLCKHEATVLTTLRSEIDATDALPLSA